VVPDGPIRAVARRRRGQGGARKLDDEEIPVPDRLTDDELRTLATLLYRFASTDLDQWELWRFGTEHGEIFVEIMRRPTPGARPGAYDDISRWIDAGQAPPPT
jgi:hypothetical protein